VAGADLAFINDQDLGLMLNRRFEGRDPADRLAAAAAVAFEAFPRLQRVAATTRAQHEVASHDLSASLFIRDGAALTTRTYALAGIVDRIGAGDAFAAGMLHGMLRRMSDQEALDFALAAACAKHGIHGDFNLATVQDIEAILAGGSLGVRR
jgi:2-dehydro-3-deoxygluconokinase